MDTNKTTWIYITIVASAAVLSKLGDLMLGAM